MPLTPSERERLKRHAETLQLWERARGHQCGPKTLDGKQRSAMRGLKHGLGGAAGIAMYQWLSGVNSLCKSLRRP